MAQGIEVILMSIPLGNVSIVVASHSPQLSPCGSGRLDRAETAVEFVLVTAIQSSFPP
jgi:hypothetical protein